MTELYTGLEDHSRSIKRITLFYDHSATHDTIFKKCHYGSYCKTASNCVGTITVYLSYVFILVMQKMKTIMSSALIWKSICGFYIF